MTLTVHSIEEEPTRNIAEASGDAAFGADPAFALGSLHFESEPRREVLKAKR